MRFALVFGFVAVFSLTARAADPTCALLASDKSVRSPLVEAKLLASPGTTWVERAAIDKVLKEQKLQAAFGAQGVGDRVRLGKLLKADVLVLMREVKTPEGVLVEVVVSETASGLRLWVRNVPATKDTTADVAAIVAVALDGIKKHGEAVKEIVAAPPFVSNDLSNQFDHLKGAYTRLVESVAFDRKGTVVVEFAEAEALAKELALTAPGSKVERAAPLYLIGEFRHDGKLKDRTVTLKLRAERAGKVVGKAETITVKPVEAPTALRKWAAGILDASGAAVTPPPDTKAETKRLNELAAIHRRLGNLAEARSLLETSLLINPDQPEVNAATIEVLRRWISSIDVRRASPDHIRKAIAIHRRALEHVETLVLVGVNEGPNSKAPLRFFTSDLMLGWAHRPEVAAECDEFRRYNSEFYERLLMLVLPRRNWGIEISYYQAAIFLDDATDKFAKIQRILLAVRELPGARQRFINFTLNGQIFLATLAEVQTFREVLDRVEDGASDEVKPIIALARQNCMLAERRLIVGLRSLGGAVVKLINSTAQAPPAPKLDVLPKSFTKIQFTSPPDSIVTRSIYSVVPCGPGVDVFLSCGSDSWSGPDWGTVFIMKQAGKLRSCYQVKGSSVRFGSVVYDGRYVWGSASRDGAPAFFVLDPTTEKVVYEFGEKDGLPVPKVEKSDRLSAPMILALDPGRVCVSGFVGRGWVGVATFDPKNGGDVKVIHEAKEARVPNDAAQQKEARVSFWPRAMYRIKSEPEKDGKTTVRVLLIRQQAQNTIDDYGLEMLQSPLLIDPDTGVVQVRTIYDINRFPLVATPDSLLILYNMTLTNGPTKNASQVMQIDINGKLHVIGPAPECRNARPITHFDGEQVHIVRTYPGRPTMARSEPPTWWLMSKDGKTFREVATNFPNIINVCHSSHYGLIAVLEPKKGDAGPMLYSVKFDPPK